MTWIQTYTNEAGFEYTIEKDGSTANLTIKKGAEVVHEQEFMSIIQASTFGKKYRGPSKFKPDKSMSGDEPKKASKKSAKKTAKPEAKKAPAKKTAAKKQTIEPTDADKNAGRPHSADTGWTAAEKTALRDAQAALEKRGEYRVLKSLGAGIARARSYNKID